MKASLGFFLFLFAIFAYVEVDASSENYDRNYVDCETVIPDRQETIKKIREEWRKQSTSGTGGTSPFPYLLPDDHSTCNMRMADVCGKYDTGKRCIVAPCPDVFKLMYFKDSCAACRDLHVYGVYDQPCNKVNNGILE